MPTSIALPRELEAGRGDGKLSVSPKSLSPAKETPLRTDPFNRHGRLSVEAPEARSSPMGPPNLPGHLGYESPEAESTPTNPPI